MQVDHLHRVPEPTPEAHQRRRSDSLNDHAMRVRRKRFQIVRIRRQDRAAWLCYRNNERVDRRTAARSPTQQGGSSCKALRNPIQYIAGL